MRGARFDATISLGTILQTITVLVALWGLAARVENRLSTLELKIEPLWQAFIESHSLRIP